MLFICSLSSYRKKVAASRGGIDLLDLPAHVRKEHEFRGLLLPTDLLAGAEASRFDALRTAADKAQCPCLALSETTPASLCGDPDEAGQARERLRRVLVAAQRLGCSAVGFSVQSPTSEEAMERVSDALREIATSAERMEMNLLIRPNRGLTQDPANVTEIIKRVGGFRLGVIPDFADAAASGDANAYLRRLAPYAPIVTASTTGFDDKGKHQEYDLEEMCDALRAIGFNASIAIEYRGTGDIDKGVQQSLRAIEPLMMEERA